MATEKPVFVERSLEECIKDFWRTSQHRPGCTIGECRCGLDRLYGYANEKLAPLRANHKALVEAARAAMQAFRDDVDCPAAWPSAHSAAIKCQDALAQAEALEREPEAQKAHQQAVLRTAEAWLDEQRKEAQG